MLSFFSGSSLKLKPAMYYCFITRRNFLSVDRHLLLPEIDTPQEQSYCSSASNTYLVPELLYIYYL
jgi:hypothetical protein